MTNQKGFKMLSKKENYVTGRVILQFSNFKEPYKFNEKSDPKYSATVLIPKSNKEEIENLKKIVIKHWKEGNIPKDGDSPLKDGNTLIEEKKLDGKELDDAFKEFFQFRSNSKLKFKVVTKNPKIAFTGEETEIKGYWCRLSVDFYAYKAGKNIGVTSYLKAVQVIEPSNIDLPGGDPADVFNEEQTSNNEDDIPF